MNLFAIGFLTFMVVLIGMIAIGARSSGEDHGLTNWDPFDKAGRRSDAHRDDLAEMLEVENRRRRAHGLAEITENDL